MQLVAQFFSQEVSHQSSVVVIFGHSGQDKKQNERMCTLKTGDFFLVMYQRP
jgi:hypothetical protein